MVAVQTQVAPEKTQQGEDQKHPLLQSNALQPPIEILPPTILQLSVTLHGAGRDVCGKNGPDFST